MARPSRLEFPCAVYHLTSRGNARRPIFKDDRDRSLFLTLPGHVADRYGWLCHADCLMDIHDHLPIETPQPTSRSACASSMVDTLRRTIAGMTG